VLPTRMSGNLSIDHIATAWSNHTTAVEQFTDGGLSPQFGGEHADGTTQMSIVPFADGSYLELISPTETTQPGETVRWSTHIGTDAGPCAWAIEPEDIVAAAKRSIDAGEPIVGPQQGGRTRPDDVMIEWDELFVGPESDRFALPFFVTDRTPKSYRVPSEWAHDGPITGIAELGIAVSAIEPWATRFKRLFRIPTPIETSIESIDAIVASIPGEPVSFLSPKNPHSPLKTRLDRYPPGPAYCLFAVNDLSQAVDMYPVSSPTTFGDQSVCWFEGPLGEQFGIVEN